MATYVTKETGTQINDLSNKKITGHEVSRDQEKEKLMKSKVAHKGFFLKECL